MTELPIRCIVLLLPFLLLTSTTRALDDVPLDPLVLAKHVTGECFVSQPGSTQLVAVADGRAYHFGNQFRTGSGGSMALMFSAANVCKIGANSLITPTARARNDRNVELHCGKIEISVEEGFDKKITVETKSRVICNARTGSFSAELSPSADGGESLTLTSGDGDSSFDLRGPHFSVAEMKKDHSLRIRNSRDLSFIRLTNAKGTFNITIKDSEGNPKDVETKSGQSLKIWSAKLSGGRRAVRVLITTQEGSLITNNEGQLDESQAVIDFIDSE